VVTVPEGLLALSISALICYVSHGLARAIGMPPQFITIVTAVTVALATVAPARLAPLVPSAEGLAQILMQVELPRSAAQGAAATEAAGGCGGRAGLQREGPAGQLHQLDHRAPCPSA
jgi:hypothetical protein